MIFAINFAGAELPRRRTLTSTGRSPRNSDDNRLLQVRNLGKESVARSVRFSWEFGSGTGIVGSGLKLHFSSLYFCLYKTGSKTELNLPKTIS